ncbi:MAG: hypothetical protein FJX62_17570 [Alphaproteobacteria bacterium]|nr:hypothetical protein [Alphaproteobacteria bacterium]
MGITKRLMMEAEELHYTALSVLCEAGTLKECAWHGGSYLEGSGDLLDAYKLGSSQLKSGEISGYSQKELTDKIKELGELWWPDSCPYCEKM